MNKFLSRALSYIVGLFILSFGVSLIIKADLGAGAWDALNVALSETIAFTIGSWVIIVGLILIGINALMLKRRPDLYALLTVSIVGVLIDFWLLIVFSRWGLETLFEQMLVFLFGLIALSFGISTYLQAKFAPVPVDSFMIAIQYRTGFNLMVSKTIGELSAMLIALILGGPVGIGTIIVTFTVGPLIQFFYPRLENLINKKNNVSTS